MLDPETLVAAEELFPVTSLTRGSWLTVEQQEALIRRLKRRQPAVINTLARPAVTLTFYRKDLLSLALTRTLPLITLTSKQTSLMQDLEEPIIRCLTSKSDKFSTNHRLLSLLTTKCT
jgi:hypothetical protein